MEKRYSELDALRGIAVLTMIGFHLCFDLAYFYEWNIPINSTPFLFWARGTATVFLLLVGICFMISWQRESSKSETQYDPLKEQFHLSYLKCYKKYALRGVTIFTGGLIISFITWVVAPGAFVKFGILHLIGISALLQPLFARLGAWNHLIGFVIIIIGTGLMHTSTTSHFLFPFGLTAPGFTSIDYYPLLPWFGVILIGMAVGDAYYAPRASWLASLGSLPIPKCFLWIGKNAFWIYFLHQPIMFLILILILGPMTIG